MNHLTYIVPGLIPERFSGSVPELPYLEQLLAHAKVNSLAYRLTREQCSTTPLNTSQARETAERANLTSRYPHWLLSTPIHLHVEGDGLVLMDAHTFPIARSESEALVTTFNQHFLSEGLEFFILSESLWLIGSHHPLTTNIPHPLSRAGRSIAPYLPQGEQDKFWRQLFNELQMLCHEHSVNLKREQDRLRLIHGVWFWDSLTQLSLPTIEVITHLEAHAAYGDWERWSEELINLDNSLFKQIYEQLKLSQGEIRLFATDHPNSREIIFNPVNKWKFWRRPISLSTLI